MFAVEYGFDMFDCVLATRLGRHGVAFSKKLGFDDKFVQMKLRNAQFREDFSLLTDDCPCYVCQTHTRAYIHHLVREKEMLAGILLSLHNIVFLHKLLFDRRKKVLGR